MYCLWIFCISNAFPPLAQVTVFDQQTQRKLRSLKAGGAEEANATLAWKTIEGLSHRTSYIIRVQAENKAGLSKAADEIFVKTRGEHCGDDCTRYGLQGPRTFYKNIVWVVCRLGEVTRGHFI